MKVLLYKRTWPVTAGAFSTMLGANRLYVPYGYRIIGAAGWLFQADGSSAESIVFYNNGPTDQEIWGWTPDKQVRHAYSCNGEVDVDGTFTFIIPCVRVEDVEFYSE